MKNLRINIPDELYDRLHALCDHHGEYSHMIRKAIIQFILKEETKRNAPSDRFVQTSKVESPENY